MPMDKIARPIMVSMLLRSLFLFRNRRILRSIMLVIISGGASCSQRRDVSRKVIVLSVNGLLCFEQYIKCTPRRFNPRNIMARPGLLEFFRILLNNFEVGIWSSMAPARLSKVIRYLLPDEIRLRLLFCYGRNKCSRPHLYPFCDKELSRLVTDEKTKHFCRPDKILMVDDQPMRHVFNGDLACYFPTPWSGEMTLPNAANVIPDVATALLPFILPLKYSASVKEYLRRNQKDGKFKRRLIERWHIERVLRSDGGS